ncbi:hypothetical protein GCM10023310_72110 [Paenibacillus vulneris]|uniref:Holin n=1 Tax=Paenibacillus vulneris TaxID=1133364 RepID=A0ABW3UGM2_9BACL
MPEMTNEILMLAAVVTSFVGVFKSYGIPSKHNHVICLAIAAIFVLVPENIKQVLLTISLVGLTASGAYQYSKSPKQENGGEIDVNKK